MQRRQPGQRVEATNAECADWRVVLRRLSEEDLRAAPWLDRASLDPNGDALAITSGGKLVDVMEYRVGVPDDGWLAFSLVAVERRLRGLGLDSEAVRVMEDDARKRGMARRFWASVHANDGLALYFWLRLGYRPARLDEVLWSGGRQHDIIVMIRVSQSRQART